MIPVTRLPPGDQWDQHLLELLFANKLYPTGLDFKWYEPWPDVLGTILLIPGRYWSERTDEISDHIADYQWVLGIRCGDEADEFDINRIGHKNLRWLVQTPRTDRGYGAARLFGVGYPPHFDNLPQEPPEKTIDVFLSGQNTNPRRNEAFSAAKTIPGATVNPTPGFARGFKPGAYTQAMADTKIAPCPAGPNTPDTFRLFEALQAHCVPIADDITPHYDSAGYWRMIFPGAPFPILEDYEDLYGWIDDQLTHWPANANRITAWWMRTKHAMSHWISEDLKALNAI